MGSQEFIHLINTESCDHNFIIRIKMAGMVGRGGGRGQEQDEVDLKLPLGLERGLSILLWGGGGLGASSSPDIALFNRIS